MITHEGPVYAVDGGAIWNLNLASAVQRCRDIVDDDSQIIVDVVVCAAHDLTKWTDQKNTVGNYLRAKDIKDYHVGMSDFIEVVEAYPKVNFRYFVQPSQKLPGTGLDTIKVDNATITWPMQLIGRDDGAAILGAGEGYMFKKISEWKNSPDLQKEYPAVGQYLSHVMTEVRESYNQKQKSNEGNPDLTS